MTTTPTTHGYQATIHLDGDRVGGDIVVTGFHTTSAASDIAWVFAEALRHRFPGAVVSAEITKEGETP